MADVYDMPPIGFTRSGRGWLVKPSTHGDKRLARLEKENKELKQMLQTILEKLGDNSSDIRSPR